jgi:hypothetical protein
VDEETAITEGLRFAGLRESQRGLVRTYLHQDPAEWMSCCGSYCDPCVLTIGHAVAKARALLGLPEWPQPKN